MIFSFNNASKENFILNDDFLTKEVINEIEEMLSKKGKKIIINFINIYQYLFF